MNVKANALIEGFAIIMGNVNAILVLAELSVIYIYHVLRIAPRRRMVCASRTGYVNAMKVLMGKPANLII